MKCEIGDNVIFITDMEDHSLRGLTGKLISIERIICNGQCVEFGLIRYPHEDQQLSMSRIRSLDDISRELALL